MIRILFALMIVLITSAGLPAQDSGALLKQADSVFESNAYDQSREIYLKAAAVARENGDKSVLTEANAMIARTYLLEGNPNEGRRYLAETVGSASPDEPVGWSRYLGVRGRFEWNNKNTIQATDTFKEMFYYCQEHKLWDRAVDAAHMVAIVGTPEQQIEWSQKGIAIAEEHDVGRWLGPLWNNLGATHEDNGNFPEALQAYLKAREFHYKFGSERNKLIADWAVGHAYHLVDSLDRADSILLPLVEWSQRLNNVEFLGWTTKELGEIRFAKQDYKQAVEYLTTALRNLREAGMMEWDKVQYKELAKSLENAKIMFQHSNFEE